MIIGMSMKVFQEGVNCGMKDQPSSGHRPVHGPVLNGSEAKAMDVPAYLPFFPSQRVSPLTHPLLIENFMLPTWTQCQQL